MPRVFIDNIGTILFGLFVFKCNFLAHSIFVGFVSIFIIARYTIFLKIVTNSQQHNFGPTVDSEFSHRLRIKTSRLNSFAKLNIFSFLLADLERIGDRYFWNADTPLLFLISKEFQITLIYFVVLSGFNVFPVVNKIWPTCYKSESRVWVGLEACC